jgi:hypothetical protein
MHFPLSVLSGSVEVNKTHTSQDTNQYYSSYDLHYHPFYLTNPGKNFSNSCSGMLSVKHFYSESRNAEQW